jgi:hypothetical protein
MAKTSSIKPQDIVLLMKMIVSSIPQAQRDLAAALEISPAEVSYASQRLRTVGLIGSSGVNLELAFECLAHAVKFICPPVTGPLSVGLPTSFCHPDFKFVKYADSDKVVWPYAHGNIKGTSIIPIYPSLPKACSNDPALYRLASLVEMIRAGRAREKTLATEELKISLGMHK